MNRYYLALGDSITAGYGVGERNFASLYYSYLNSINPYLYFFNCGINGLTTGCLANLILTGGRIRNLIMQSDILTVTIGSNDLLLAGSAFLRGKSVSIPLILSGMDSNLDLIGWQIRLLNSGAWVKIATIYNPLPAGPFFQYSGTAQKIINQANKIIVRRARQYGFRVIPVDSAFQGREQLVIGPDYLHPNSLGHEIIAAAAIDE